MSRLVIKNNKIILNENIKQNINSNKQRLKEDVTSISLQSAGSMLTDTVQSTLKISQGIITNFLTNMKFMISLALLPLTRNLDNIVKSYESEIKESNKLFLESIPQNVAGTAKLIAIPATSTSIFFEKVAQEFEKVEGIKEIINAKSIPDLSFLTGPIKNMLERGFSDTYDITKKVLEMVLKDIPKELAGNSYYYSNSKENRELQELRDKLFGEKNTEYETGISGLPIKIEDDTYLKILQDKIINPVYSATASSDKNVGILKSIADKKENDINIINCIYNIKNFTSTSFPWKTNGAISPNNKSLKVRYQLDFSPGLFITIEKNKEKISSSLDLESCYIALDNGRKQVTKDFSFSEFKPS